MLTRVLSKKKKMLRRFDNYETNIVLQRRIYIVKINNLKLLLRRHIKRN